MGTGNDDNEILSFIDKYGVHDKDSTGVKKPKRKKKLFKKVGKRLRKVVDLHGMTQDEAVVTLRNSFLECKRRGIDSILIIHGVGNNSDPAEGPILKKTVRAMLKHELSADIRDFCKALPKDGGDGATVVWLK